MQNFPELSGKSAYYYEVRNKSIVWNNLRYIPIIPKHYAVHYNLIEVFYEYQCKYC